MFENKTVVIMRGISGSGKSTYVRKNFPDAAVCSADDYFIKAQTGEYQFDATKLKEAHEQCFGNFKRGLERQEQLIVVDNTNTRLWEFERYFNSAYAAGYDIKIIRMSCPSSVAAVRNEHDVPEHAVKAMEDRFESYPSELIVSSFEDLSCYADDERNVTWRDKHGIR